MSEIGFHVNRTITIKASFERNPHADEMRSEAVIEDQGRMYQVRVVMDPLHHARLFEGMTDRERENARQWLALIEIAQYQTRNLEGRPGASSRVDVSTPESERGQKWAVDELRRHVERQLVGYDLQPLPSGCWQVRAT